MSKSELVKKKMLCPVQVFVRVRPLNDNDGLPAIKEITAKEIWLKSHRKYTFDQVFAEHVSQLSIYKSVVANKIGDVLKGYNCSIFAYGQTGTGKTYTIQGGESIFSIDEKFNWEEDSDAGIVLRASMHLYEELEKLTTDVQRTVTVSFMEIYNEELRDLLCDDRSSPLRIYEDKSKAVRIKNLKEVTVLNPWEILSLLKLGCERRKVASTLMNSHSSRSHSVFTISVNKVDPLSESANLSNVTCGKLNLIDLAGSENIGRSGSTEQRAREASNINQSLLTLGRVIKALVEKSAHVPYRESKLTRILQDSLGGQTKTTIIATISPGMSSLDETVNTLEYAHNARNVTTAPVIHFRKSTVSAEINDEIAKLRKDINLVARQGGIYMHKDNYEEINRNLADFKQNIATKHEVIQSLSEKLDDLIAQKEECENLKKSFEITKTAYEQCKNELLKRKSKIEKDNNLIKHYKDETTRFEDHAKYIAERETRLLDKVDSLYEKSKNNVFSSQIILEGVRRNMNEMLENENKNSQQIVNKSAELASSLSRISNMLQNVITRLDDHKKQCLEVNSSLVDVNTKKKFQKPFDEIIQFKYSLENSRDNINPIIERMISCKNSTDIHFADSDKAIDDLHQATTTTLKLNEIEAKRKFEGMGSANAKLIENLETKLERFKSVLLDEARTDFQELERILVKKRQRMHNLQTVVVQFGFNDEVSQYRETMKKLRQNVSKTAVFNGNIQSLSAEVRLCLNLVVDDFRRILEISSSKEILENIRNLKERYCTHMSNLFNNIAQEQHENSRVLQQITDTMNSQGRVNLEHINRLTEAKAESLCTSATKLRNDVRGIMNHSVQRVEHIGDTPPRINLNTVTRRSVSSLRNLTFDEDVNDADPT